MFSLRNCIQASAGVAALTLGGHAFASGGTGAAPPKPHLSKVGAGALMARAQSQFTENNGQWSGTARFVSRSTSVDLAITRDGARFDFHRQQAGHRTGQVIAMSFVGAKATSAPVGESPDPGTFAYVHAKQKVLAHRYGSVLEKGIYPGIDARFYREGDRPRYDIVVAPHADPQRVAMRYVGAYSVKVRPSQVTFGTVLGDVQETKLFAYQADAHGRHPVPATFMQHADGTVGFSLGAYDHNRQLVIDPLVYGSYYGGEGGWDQVRSVVESPANNAIFMVGYTQSVSFPAINGPYQWFNLNGPRDGFVAELAGDAYTNIYATYVGGSQSDICQYAQLDQNGNLWVAGSTQSIDYPAQTTDTHGNPVTNNIRDNVEFLQLYQDGIGDIAPVASGGSFLLSSPLQTTGELAWNQDTPTVQAEVNTITDVDLNVGITGTLPGTLRIPLLDPGALTVTSNYVGGDIFGNPNQNPEEPDTNEGLEPRYLIDLNAQQNPTSNIIIRRGSYPTGGYFAISFAYNGSIQTTAAIPYNASPGTVAAALNALTNLNGGKFQCGGGSLPPASGSLAYGAADPFSPAPQGVNPVPALTIQFQTSTTTAFGPVPNANLFISYGNVGLTDGPGGGLGGINVSALEIHVPNFLFVQRWARNTASGLLDPLTNLQTWFFGGDQDNTISGFAVQPGLSPTNTTVSFGFAGNEDDGLYQNTTDPVTGAYLARYTWDPVNSFKPIGVKYLGESAPLLIGGYAMDSSGDSYVAGEIEFAGNDQNPTGDGIFTTRGGWGDNAIRNRDVFIRKYNSTLKPASNTIANGLIWSGIIGGNADDFIGGFDFDPDATVENTGSAVAVDASGNAYVTGLTESFDFPRTRGVVGQTFVSPPDITCFAAKVSADGSQLLYSTSLNTQTILMNPLQIAPHRIGIGLGGEWVPSPVLPAGIAVDGTGNAFITGNAHPQWVSFPDPASLPGNPNEPTGVTLPTIPLVNPLVSTYSTVATPDYPTAASWLSVLNSTAQQFIISTWLDGTSGDGGTNLGQQIFAPYVNQFGDVWLNGMITSQRVYARTITKVYSDGLSGLPNELISPLAFKSVPDQSVDFNSGLNSIYGAYQHDPAFQPYASQPVTWPMYYATDGFLAKLRLTSATVSSVTFNPDTLPGGAGAVAVGTVTLSSAAPAGGANVLININTNTAAASLTSGTQTSQLTITIPAGSTSGNFNVYSNAVLSTTAVQIQCTYLGSFQIAQLNVVPWLQSIGITPATVVGGNASTGLITLATTPANPITISLASSNTGVAKVPASVTVPAGQSTTTFTITTVGVTANKQATITASFGGVNQTATIQATPASLSSLTFSPASIASAGTTQATVSLNGAAGAATPLTVTLPTGYFVIGASSPTIPAQATSASFYVQAPFVTTQQTANVSVSGTIAGVTSSASGSFTVTVDALSGLTLSPNSTLGGNSVTGTIRLSQPAPSSGVTVNLTSSLPSAITGLPASVTVPASANSATFTFGTVASGVQHVMTISAYLGPNLATSQSVSTATLTILPIPLKLSISPASVVGGFANATGTVTLPPGVTATSSVTVTLSSSNASAKVPSSITVPKGSTTGTFTITTSYVSVSTPVTIKATAVGQTASAALTVSTIGVASVSFKPSLVLGGTYSTMTVTLSQAVPAGKSLVVSLSYSNYLFRNAPTTLVITSGQKSVSAQIETVIVPVEESTFVTASAPGNGGSATGVLFVNSY